MNRKTKHRAAVIFGVLGVVLLQPSGASARDADRQPAEPAAIDMVDSRLFSSGIDLTPRVRYTRAILTLSGNGGVFRKVFEAGEALEIGLYDPEGQPLADGSYRWELRLEPDAKTAEKLRTLTRAKEPTSHLWTSAAGNFVVRGGAVDTSALRELEPARASDPSSQRHDFKSLGGAMSFEDRSSDDSDEAVAAGLLELRGAEVEALGHGVDAAAARAPELGAENAVALDGDQNVAAGTVTEKTERAALADRATPTRRLEKYPTPDNQGRPEGATRKRD